MSDAPLKINLSDEELASEGRSFDPLPTGNYICNITDIELRESKSEKNPGAPYWAVEMTVQEGPHIDRKIWANVMLWAGAAFSLVQLLKATNMLNVDDKNNVIVPSADDLVGKQVLAVVKKQRDKYAEERDGDGVAQFKNEVKGFKNPSEAKVTVGAKSGAGSLLP